MEEEGLQARLDSLRCEAECVPRVPKGEDGACAPGNEDLEELHAQLGRTPRWVKGVAVRCALGHPVVFETYPVDPQGPYSRPRGRLSRASISPGACPDGDGSAPDIGPVFPTLYWLSCPSLVSLVSQLESRGGVAQARHLAMRDPAFGARLAAAHRAYAADRVASLRLPRPRQAGGGESPWPASIRDAVVGSGVGGVRSADRPGVKCLHAHLAHYLAQVAHRASATAANLNPVGEWVARSISTGLDTPHAT